MAQRLVADAGSWEIAAVPEPRVPAQSTRLPPHGPHCCFSHRVSVLGLAPCNPPPRSHRADCCLPAACPGTVLPRRTGPRPGQVTGLSCAWPPPARLSDGWMGGSDAGSMLSTSPVTNTSRDAVATSGVEATRLGRLTRGGLASGQVSGSTHSVQITPYNTGTHRRSTHAAHVHTQAPAQLTLSGNAPNPGNAMLVTRHPFHASTDPAGRMAKMRRAQQNAPPRAHAPSCFLSVPRESVPQKQQSQP